VFSSRLPSTHSHPSSITCISSRGEVGVSETETRSTTFWPVLGFSSSSMSKSEPRGITTGPGYSGSPGLRGAGSGQAGQALDRDLAALLHKPSWASLTGSTKMRTVLPSGSGSPRS